MTTISPEYKELNRIYHTKSKGYGDSAKRFLTHIAQVLLKTKPRTVLDYGCGKESFWRMLKKKYPQIANDIDYFAYDPAIPGRDTKVKRIVDLVVCTDVLEHVEPEYLEKVLKEIKETAGKMVYINIATKKSGDILPDGRNAHLIIHEGDWWKDVLLKAFPGWKIEEPEVLAKNRNYTVILTRPKNEDLNIVCFYWQGKGKGNLIQHRPGWEDINSGVEYVNKLFRSVTRNLDKKFDFICFSNETGNFDKGIEIRKFEPLSWGGCFPKLYCHSKEAGLKGRVLVFDLDVVITGKLNPFANYDGPFTTREEMRGEEHTGRSGGDLLGFTAGETYQLWENYKNCKTWLEAKAKGGDERIIYNTLWDKLHFWQRELPGMLISYKRDIKEKGLTTFPKEARIISFHGKPRPSDLVDSVDWIKQNWG